MDASTPDPSTTSGAIVVGVDGTELDPDCVAWAVDTARLTHRPIVLLHALPDFGELVASEEVSSSHDLDPVAPERRESVVLEQAIKAVRSTHSAVEVTGQTLLGRPEKALVDASEDAYVVVVGSKPRRGVDRLALGRSAYATAAHSLCPVVVIRQGTRSKPSGPVLVATDGSSASGAAVARAAVAAEDRGTSLVVLTTWLVEMVNGFLVTTPGTDAWKQVEKRQRALADGVVAPVRQAHPDLKITVRVERGAAAPTLIDAARGVSLLVVGSRGRGGFRGMRLGSVTQQIIESADVTVMIVPSPRG